MCAQIDSVSGKISVSLNGRPPLTKRSEKLRKEDKPEQLENHLELGITDTQIVDGGKRSFNGKVSNVHFHFADGLHSQIECINQDLRCPMISMDKSHIGSLFITIISLYQKKTLTTAPSPPEAKKGAFCPKYIVLSV